MVQFNSLENMKKKYPHFFNKDDDSNFTKHLTVVNNQQQDIRHKLKAIEWGRLLEKPLQIWKSQSEPYFYDINVRVNVPSLKTVKVYKNPILKDDKVLNHEGLLIDEEWEEDTVSFYENTIPLETQVYDTQTDVHISFDEEIISDNGLDNYVIVDALPTPDKEDMGNVYFIDNGDYNFNAYIVQKLTQEEMEQLGYGEDDVVIEHVKQEDTLYESSEESIDNLNISVSGDSSIRFKTNPLTSISIIFGNQILSIYDNIWDIDGEYSGEYNSEIAHEWEMGVDNSNEEYCLFFLKCDNETLKTIQITPNYLPFIINRIIVWEGKIENVQHITTVEEYYGYVAIYEDIPRTIDTTVTEYRNLIPSDNFLLEITTHDDYCFLKGYPQNDYTVKEDNILQYQYNSSFLDISTEIISYVKYLVFRVHQDNIRKIRILKNEKPYFTQEFVTEFITPGKHTDSSFYYYDKDDNESIFNGYYDIENEEANKTKHAFANIEEDEYVYYLPLSEEDTEIHFIDYVGDYVLDIQEPSAETLDKYVIIKENNQYNAYRTVEEDGVFSLQLEEANIKYDYIVKDTWDLVVNTYEKRYYCQHEYERTYSKRYNGYDGKLNDCFDHDYSLDIIGNMLNVPRLRFYQVYSEDEDYLSKTYPPYFNRSTEDDYNYMCRIQRYINNYNHTPFPVLEFEKYYCISPKLRNRKEIVGEMGETYVHYNGEDLICDSDFLGSLDKEDTGETETGYSLNKATSTKGRAIEVSRGNSIWHECVIVKDVFIVPNTQYRLRFGINSNEEEVTIRMICYDREGNSLRSIGKMPELEELPPLFYNVSEGYEYYDSIIEIPGDTSSVKIILESNSSFDYTDVTLERMKVVSLDDKYMATTEDYNSNFYELYCNFEDIPTNIRMGNGERFKILLQRSLPLTKKGILYMDILNPFSSSIGLSDSYELFVENLLLENNEEHQRSAVIDNTHTYYQKVENNLMVKNEVYELEIHFSMESTTMNPYVHDETIELPQYNDNELMSVEIEHYDNEDVLIESEVLDDKIYSDTPTRILYHFNTPYDDDFSYIKIRIQSSVSTELEKIRLGRIASARIEELCD